MRKASYFGLLVLAFVALAPIPALPLDRQKHDDIRQLIAITGAQKNAEAMIDAVLPQIMGLIRKANPAIPQEIIDQLQREGRAEFLRSMPDFVESMVAVYDDSYTADEIKQILAFYQTPLGQKVIARTPVILQKSIALGQIWGKQVGERVVERMRSSAKKKGYDL